MTCWRRSSKSLSRRAGGVSPLVPSRINQRASATSGDRLILPDKFAHLREEALATQLVCSSSCDWYNLRSAAISRRLPERRGMFSISLRRLAAFPALFVTVVVPQVASGQQITAHQPTFPISIH